MRAAFGYDRDKASLEAGFACDPDEESVVQQQFKEEVDINTIVKRFGLTGQMPEIVRVPHSGDFTGISDFQSAMEAVRRAQEGFMELPAEIRAKFRNDPQELLVFLDDPRNRDDAVKLGLVNKPPEKTRDVVQAVDELAKVLTPKAS